MDEADKLVMSTPTASSSSSTHSGCESIFSPSVERKTRARCNRHVLDNRAGVAPLPMLCPETEGVANGDRSSNNHYIQRNRRSKRRNCSTMNNGVSKNGKFKKTKSNNNVSRITKPIPRQIWDPILDRYFQFWFDHRIRTTAATTSDESTKQQQHQISIQAPSRGDNSSALLQAAKIGDETSVILWLIYRMKILQDEGEDIHNIRQMKPGGYNALHVATKYGHVSIAKLLLDNHIGIFKRGTDVPTMYGQTALHIAARYGQLSMASYLVEECAANINHKSSKTGETPLMSAIAGIERSNFPLVQYIVSQPQLDINQQDRFGQTALQLALQKNDNTCLENDRIVEFLLRVGKANPNIASSTTQGHQTPFHFVPYYKQNWISTFLSAGADATIQDSFSGDTVVHYWLKQQGSTGNDIGIQRAVVRCSVASSRSVRYRRNIGQTHYRSTDLWNAMFLLLESEKRNARCNGETGPKHVLLIANYKGETPYKMIMESNDIRLQDLISKYI